MTAWAEFENAEPDLAAFARERMEGRVVYQATLRLMPVYRRWKPPPPDKPA